MVVSLVWADLGCRYAVKASENNNKQQRTNHPVRTIPGEPFKFRKTRAVRVKLFTTSCSCFRIKWRERRRKGAANMDDSPQPPSNEQSPPPPPPQSQSHTGSPTDFLKGVVGKRVVVRLVSGVDYKGALCDWPLSSPKTFWWPSLPLFL